MHSSAKAQKDALASRARVRVPTARRLVLRDSATDHDRRARDLSHHGAERRTCHAALHPGVPRYRLLVHPPRQSAAEGEEGRSRPLANAALMTPDADPTIRDLQAVAKHA